MRKVSTKSLPVVRTSAGRNHFWLLAGVVAIVLFAFWPMLSNDFVNWDDPTVIAQNSHLTSPHVVPWAFSTTLIGHYQPLAWLTWSALARAFGTRASVFHAASLLGHLLNALLAFVVVRRLTSLASSDERLRRIAPAAAALTFAVHPLRVEAVAWASALPYVVSTGALLLSLLAYVDAQLALAVAAYAIALLVRPIALAFPFVLLVVDVYPLRRRLDRRALFDKLPFLALAIAAIVVESRARESASVADVGIGARLTMAITAPFVYLGRTMFPVRLTPLDPLPIEPAADWLRLGLGTAGLVAGALVMWRMSRRWPALAAGSIAYLLLLAPVVGLTPSGQQATADRYVYLPGLVVSALIGLAAARSWPRSGAGRAAWMLAVAVPVTCLAVLTRDQTAWWRDSITLWTRAADLDPRNDIATYNLAVALAESGRDEEAMQRYEQTLRLVPDQMLARRNLTALEARRAEREGDQLANAERLDEARDAYSRALDLDPRRLHARAARGIVLSRLGHPRDALPDLRAAYDANADDAAVINALAFALAETGRFAEAAAVLRRGVDRHRDDVNLAHNLARLLATAPDRQVRDGALAVRLALDVNDRTGGADPRVLDTLAAAYAETGDVHLAQSTAARAAARAREIGDAGLAEEIAAHARSYTKR